VEAGFGLRAGQVIDDGVVAPAFGTPEATEQPRNVLARGARRELSVRNQVVMSIRERRWWADPKVESPCIWLRVHAYLTGRATVMPRAGNMHAHSEGGGRRWAP
jgi:hypothetical protein